MKTLNALFLILILTILSSQNILWAENSKLAPSITTSSDDGKYVRTRFLQLMKKPFITSLTSSDKTKQQKKILIIGDSHAQDFLNAIAENKFLTNAQLRTRYIPTRCQIYLGNNQLKKWESNDRKLCENSDSLKLAKTQIMNADVIILVSLWRKWAAESLTETINNLHLNADQSLFVVGRRSFRKVETHAIQKLNNKELRNLRIEVDKDQLEINGIMSSALSSYKRKNSNPNKVHFINVHRLICGKGSACPVFTNNLKMISFDGGHLSPDGARYIGRELFNKTQLSRLLQH